MLNILAMPKVVLEEKINLNSKNIWNSYNVNHAIRQNTGQFIINRNLIDDTFDIKIQDIEKPDRNKRDVPYVNINGMNWVIGQNSSFYISGNERYYKNKIWEVKRGLLNNIKFSEINSFVVGLNQPHLNRQNPLSNAYYWNFMFPKFDSTPKVLISNFNKIIDIKTIEQITVTNIPNRWPITAAFINQRLKIKPKIEYKYNHIYLVPKQLDRLKTTSTFFEVYTKNESNNLIDYDFKMSKGELKSSSFPNKKMETYFERVWSESKTKNGLEFIGTIKTFDTSYYDYKTKKTKLGLSSTSQIGEQIPFNFQNDYFRSFKFGVNSIFKNINILLKETFPTPILDSGSGQVILSINKYKDKDPKNNFLNMKTINSKDLIRFQKNDLSLVAIKRISHQKIS